MPGIVGIISKKSREINERDLSIMVNCMMHEPFYTYGMYVDDHLGVYAGWVCHKGSFSDCMPIFNEKKDIVMFFSGENFPDKDLNDRLKGQGHEFDSSNASALVHFYENEGDGFLRHLNGWFNGIVVDIRQGKILLFNDRYGAQRLYYYESKDAFYFSSEAKALFKVNPELSKIDLKSLGEFFTCGCVLQNRTLFPNIFLLPGGAAWTFQNGKCVGRDYYFEPCIWENQSILETEVFYEKLRETFLTVLPRYFNSTQPIAMSLTGGMDTRMIMACGNNNPATLPCYTFGGMYRDCFDVLISRTVANACHQPHHVLHLGKEFLSDFPEYAEKTIYLSDGCFDVTGSYELYLNRLAREIAPIRMTGNYGSEVLRSVRALKAAPPPAKLFHPDFDTHIQEAEQTFSKVDVGHRLSFVVFKQAPWLGYGRLSIEQSQLTLRTPFMDNDLVGLAYQAPAQAIATNDISLKLIADCNPTLRNINTDRGVGGVSNFLSIFARLYYETLFKAEYFYNYGMPQWFALIDCICSPLHLEKLFLGRHKFHHFRVWYRDELADYIRTILLDDRTANRPYVNKIFLKEMIGGHTGGYRNYTTEISQILTVELIQRFLIEQR